MAGQVAIVTGGYSGIGLETTRALRSAGAQVVVPSRNHGRARAVLRGLDGVQIEAVDLVDGASIDAFASRFISSGRPLHILVNNAGIMAAPLVRLGRGGYESHFVTNHLGHFHLTARLWPALQKANGARVISVSSWGHRHSPLVFADVHFEWRGYDRWLAYGQSKTANVLFAVALDHRGRADRVRAFSLHPGSIVDTGLRRYLSEEVLRAAGEVDEDGMAILDPSRDRKTAEQGAATSVWCATSPQLDGLGGLYCQDSDVAPLVPLADIASRAAGAISQVGSRPTGVMSYAIDLEASDRLWRLSETLTGVALG